MKDSHIQWCDNTFNGWEGCTKVSPGCANCYAEARNQRFSGGANWGTGALRRRTSESNWNEPKKWNREAQSQVQAFNQEVQGSFGHLSEMMEAPRRPRVFCASLSDWLDDEVSIAWLADLLILVFDCGFLDWQMLTKRPQNFFLRLSASAAYIRNHKNPSERNAAIVAWIEAWINGKPPYNVWVGTTVEDQARANERIPLLLAIPAVVRFLSCEPLLERVNLTAVEASGSDPGFNALKLSDGDEGTTMDTIDWVIVGGESGPKARPTDLDAVENVIWQCREAKTACFVKQLGSKPIRGEMEPTGRMRTFAGRRQMEMKATCLVLRHPKGGDPEEWPERFRVQQFPEVVT